jgi:hypothetical protein
MARAKKAVISNEQSFRRLLNFLDADETQAAHRYERLRQQLIRYFERRECWQADLVADRTFSRAEEVLSRKTPEGPLEGRGGFVIEVGKRVLSEWWSEARRQEPPPPPPVESTTPAVERVNWQIYDLCKSSLPNNERALLDGYFQQLSKGEGKLKDARMEIAAREGIAIGALRVRIHHIKAKLEAYCLCCSRCLGGN